MTRSCCLALVAGLLLTSAAGAQDVTLIENGQAKAAIFAPARLLDDAAKNPEENSRDLNPENQRRRLRESVKDLAAILHRISGAKIDIVAGAPKDGDPRLPILIGELAAARFGKTQKSHPYSQGFRLTVSPKGIGLAGESDLATSYAIYTLLDQLGCRWYLPSAMGEVLPATKTVKLKEQALDSGPYTTYRGLWYCDQDFVRRNRMGGLAIAAGHALEFTVPKELREKNPDIKAIIGGKPDHHKVKWTHPLVAQSIADACLNSFKNNPHMPTFSLSPDDGLGWDESDDTKFDAKDFDESTQLISKTDRLMVLCNRVAEKVAAKHPQVKLGVLAYADFIRPPVREKVHPNVVPQIAPITFTRAHLLSDDGEPNNKGLRELIDGWGKKVPELSYYFYGFYLAEVAAPHPLIGRYSHDLPYIYQKGKCRYWQPETITNFETTMHGHYLGQRLAWDPTQDPQAIIAELHEKLYGSAGKAMAAYWQFIDDVWTKTPEYAGCGWGYLRRWPPEKLTQARKLMDQALAACQTDMEKARVDLANQSFTQFEKFMQLRRDLAEGRFAKLTQDSEAYRKKMIELGEKHQPQFAFGRMAWTGPTTLHVRYYDGFYKETHEDAARIAGQHQVLTDTPLRTWRWKQDKDKQGEKQGWQKTDAQDDGWKKTDVAVDTWSALGLHNYMGAVWYRASVPLGLADKKKTFLWIGSTDGRVKVFVNGKHVPHVDAKGKSADSFVGYCQPASFDITAALENRRMQQISLLCTREFLNELGSGGLLAAPVVYREK